MPNESLPLLLQDGVISVKDIDLVMSEGLGMRYAFIGPIETMHLNAPEGKLCLNQSHFYKIKLVSSCSERKAFFLSSCTFEGAYLTLSKADTTHTNVCKCTCMLKCHVHGKYQSAV